MNRKRLKAAKEYLHQEVGSRPELERLLTPDFSIEARRTVISDTYYKSLLSPKVELIPHAVTEVTPAGVVDAAGEKHDLDMIVLATGFDAANFISTYRTVGENGIVLREQWEGGADAFLGVMTPNFPNFFMIFGPNTSGIPLVTYYEAQARFAAKVIKKLAAGKARKVTVKGYMHSLYNRRSSAVSPRRCGPRCRATSTAPAEDHQPVALQPDLLHHRAALGALVRHRRAVAATWVPWIRRSSS